MLEIGYFMKPSWHWQPFSQTFLSALLALAFCEFQVRIFPSLEQWRSIYFVPSVSAQRFAAVSHLTIPAWVFMKTSCKLLLRYLPHRLSKNQQQGQRSDLYALSEVDCRTAPHTFLTSELRPGQVCRAEKVCWVQASLWGSIVLILHSYSAQFLLVRATLRTSPSTDDRHMWGLKYSALTAEHHIY